MVDRTHTIAATKRTSDCGHVEYCGRQTWLHDLHYHPGTTRYRFALIARVKHPDFCFGQYHIRWDQRRKPSSQSVSRSAARLLHLGYRMVRTLLVYPGNAPRRRDLFKSTPQPKFTPISCRLTRATIGRCHCCCLPRKFLGIFVRNETGQCIQRKSTDDALEQKPSENVAASGGNTCTTCRSNQPHLTCSRYTRVERW